MTATPSDQDPNKQLAEEWLDRLSKFRPSSKSHITECLKGFEVLGQIEKEKAQWILRSPDLHSWLNSKRPCTLSVIAETPPEALINAMACASATMAIILKQTRYPVLSVFCGLRTNDSVEERFSGALGLLNSLSGQLLRFILDKRDTADLAFLKREEFMKKSRYEPACALRLFKKLLGALHDHDTVFILLDSFSRMTGHQSDKVIAGLAKISTDMTDLSVKLLVTDPLPSCQVKQVADFSFYVQNEVPRLNDGINFARLEETQKDTIVKLKRRQRRAGHGSEEADTSDSEKDGW